MNFCSMNSTKSLRPAAVNQHNFTPQIFPHSHQLGISLQEMQEVLCTWGTDRSEVLLPFANQPGKYLKYLKSYELIHVFTGEKNPSHFINR